MASAVIGALRVNLGIDSAQFWDGLNSVQKGLKGVGKSMQRIGTTMSASVTAPLTALGAVTIRTAGNFEASMNRVQAATGATAEEIKAMRDMAVQLGADTSFSASESADAMEMLAKNGLAAAQILDGAVSASMALAAASGADLSSAADVATDVMMNFGKEAKELSGVVDGITGVVLQSKFGFDDYRLALGQAGGVAGNLGVEFEDFNAALALTSSAFASGSDAGTSFKNFLTRLVPVSDAAAAAMDELGLQFFNADGSMKNMMEIADELRNKMAGLSDQALNQAMKDIFGVDAMRTAIMLMKEGGDGIEEMRAKINDASAEEQAAARLKGFNGELEKLSGAFESLQIAIADSGLLQLVTDLVSRLAEWTDALAETNPEILKWGTVIAGLAAALGPVVLTVGLLATGIAAISAPVALVVGGIAALTTAIIAFWPEISAAGKAVNEFLVSFGEDAKAKITAFGNAIVALKDQALEAVAAMVTGIREWITGRLNAVWDGVTSKVDAVKNKFYDLYDAVVGHSFIPDMVTEIGQWMARLGASMVQPATEAADQTSQAFKGVGDSIDDAFSGFGSSVAAAIKGTKEWSDVLRDLAGQFAQLAIQNLSTGFFGSSSGGIGGFFTGLLGGLFGFANGGQFKVGGAGGVDSQIVAFRASPDETVSVTKPGQDMGARSLNVHVTASDLFHVMVREEADGRVRAAAPGIVGTAVQQANSGVVPTLASYQRDQAGGDYRG